MVYFSHLIHLTINQDSFCFLIQWHSIFASDFFGPIFHLGWSSSRSSGSRQTLRIGITFLLTFLLRYIHTHIYTHIYTSIYTHNRIHIHQYTYIHSNTNRYIRTHIHPSIWSKNKHDQTPLIPITLIPDHEQKIRPNQTTKIINTKNNQHHQIIIYAI